MEAQISYVQKAIEKIGRYNNFSYKSIYKEKEHTNDTLVIFHKYIFQKAPEDKVFGYMFSFDTLMKPNKFPRTEYYNGKCILSIYPGDSTYYTETLQTSIISESLIGRLRWIKNFLKKNPTDLKKVADTTINGVDSYHLIINTRDTIINNEHYYSRTHIFIDKQSNLPACIIGKARYENTTGKATNYYSETRYFDYKFDLHNIDLSSISIPDGFHLPKARPVLFTPGTTAPDWTLDAINGGKMSLSQLKGKVVLMDFYFIGCHNCMDALKSLNTLFEIYKDQNFVIASITARDSLRSVQEFDKNHCIKYSSYFNASDVVKSYQVDGFPTFYFIDKEGKVADVMSGYGEDFEANATSIINALLKK